MANFFKIVFGSCLGVILATLVVFVIGGTLITSLASKSEEGKKVEANSVLKINFDGPIPEKSNNVPVDPMAFEIEKTVGLHDMVAAIEHAKTNDKIKGIYLDLSNAPGGRATSATLRKALLDFKSEDKFIIAYGKSYSQGSYYMASTADEVLMNPVGEVNFLGFGVQIPFFKDMLDRLGIKMQVFYAGQFKSATEPFRRYEMSEQNRLQVGEYIEAMYANYLEDLSESRGIPTTQLRELANTYALRTAEDALKYKFVDKLVYYDEVLDNLKERLGLEEDDKIKMVSLQDYEGGNKSKINFKVKDKIAVVYAEGSIVDGEGEAGSVGGDKYASIIRKIRNEDKYKAVVLRINSGGGSGLASEIMWRELMLCKEEGLPVIATMGDVAASGGYYIACMADTILAQENTITGSIGVFGMIPSMEKMLDEKVGVTFDSVTTGPFSLGLGITSDIGKEQGAIIQKGVEDFYQLFLKRVAEGRDMTIGGVHEVAQGRVWTGEKAQALGLVDVIGDLQDAIDIAASNAGLEEYRIAEFPKAKDPIQMYIEMITGKEDEARMMLEKEVGNIFPNYKYLKEIKEMEGVQARVPFMIDEWK
ncbi:MAG: signal peptide peptidase SppA [Saprospiraceae bacterium]